MSSLPETADSATIAVGDVPEVLAVGACAGLDPDLFFPERGVPSDEAKAVCRTCPVRTACLEHALDNNERFGIWGGTSERERRRLRQARRSAAA